MPSEPGSLISETERAEAREVYFTEAVRRGEVVTVPAYQHPEELVFDFAQRWVEGTNIHNQRVRIPLDQLKRFDLDYVTRPGDDKTHYYFYLLVASAEDTLVYSERAPEPDWNPLPEPTRRDRAQTNLGALAALSRLEGRATFSLSNPEHAFKSESSAGRPAARESHPNDALITWITMFFLAVALYYVMTR